MNITINLPDVAKLAEAILDLTVAVRNAGQPAKTAPAKKSTAPLAVVPAPAPEAPAAEVPVDERESAVEPTPPAATAPTIEDVRTAVRAFLQKRGKEETAKLLAKHGAPSVPALTPDRYPAVIAEASAGAK